MCVDWWAACADGSKSELKTCSTVRRKAIIAKPIDSNPLHQVPTRILERSLERFATLERPLGRSLERSLVRFATFGACLPACLRCFCCCCCCCCCGRALAPRRPTTSSWQIGAMQIGDLQAQASNKGQ